MHHAKANERTTQTIGWRGAQPLTGRPFGQTPEHRQEPAPIRRRAASRTEEARPATGGQERDGQTRQALAGARSGRLSAPPGGQTLGQAAKAGA